MTLNDLLETVPAYARDLKLNFSSLLQQSALNEQQTWGTIVASAVASRNEEFTKAALAEAPIISRRSNWKLPKAPPLSWG